METTQKQTRAFETEVNQLLKLMIHSLYSEKEIFLRELISNASDACDKLRFLAINDPALKGKDDNLFIRVDVDKEARTIMISDNGIGMSEAEVIENIGTIAKSGTKAFLDQLTGDKKKDAQLIGQFGVGFYSCFMVSDKVTLMTRRADSDTAVMWESDGSGEYTLESVDKPTQGTTITLHIKADASEYLEAWKLREIIMKYADHISFPVEMVQEKADDKDEDLVYERVNKATALWQCSKNDLTDEEYKEFYKHVSHDFEDPLAWTHNYVEGKTEYRNLLYIPKRAGFDLYTQMNKRHGVKLYVQRVFIMDDADQFLPHYLRFVKGVIDANDLPLNVSREILQNSKVVETIKSGSTKKVLGLLGDLADNKPEEYIHFWSEFGPALKEGVIEDPSNRDAIAKLLRFASTLKDDPSQTVSLSDYIARMKEGQTHIYYVTAETFSAAKNSPHLEIFRKKGIEVLLLSDRVDEWLTGYLTEFEGKVLESVAKGNLDLGTLDSQEEAKVKEADASFKDLITAFKVALGDAVKDVRMTHRLTQSPACVVADANDMGLQMQRIFKAAGQAMPTSKPILELNPEHSLMIRLNQHPEQESIKSWAQLLLDQAILAEGGHLDDPAAFVKRMNELLM